MVILLVFLDFLGICFFVERRECRAIDILANFGGGGGGGCGSSSFMHVCGDNTVIVFLEIFLGPVITLTGTRSDAINLFHG